MTDLETKTRYLILYDFYSPLLTEKQRNIFEAYYGDDYSLGELANEFEISRNAIWDTLNKVCHNLDSFEEKLHLHEADQKLNAYLDDLSNHTDEEGKALIKKIKEMRQQDFDSLIEEQKAHPVVQDNEPKKEVNKETPTYKNLVLDEPHLIEPLESSNDKKEDAVIVSLKEPE